VVPIRRLDAAVVAVLLAAGIAYIPLAAQFLPAPSGRLGHDYAYYLPLLLAGKYWIARNGVLAIPYFSPAFCGGLPLLANPRSIFYSAPQLFSLVMDPVQAFLATTVLSAWLAGLGAFLLLRRRFAASLPASGLAAAAFMFNTFLLHRMAIGHVAFHVIGLAPLLCHLLLTPLRWSVDRRRAVARAAAAVAGAGMILAYTVYAGACNITVPMALTAVAVWLLHALLRRPAPSFWVLAPAAAVLGGALAAMMLVPAAVLLGRLPRPEPLRIFPDTVSAITALAGGLFWPGLVPNAPNKHEYDYGVGLVPFVALLAGLSAVLARGTWRRWPGLAGWLKLGALGVVLALPPWLNSGGPQFAAWLGTVPYIGENVTLIRWFLIYILPISLGTGLILDHWTARAEVRAVLALAGIVATAAAGLIADQSYYLRQPYDPLPVLAADRALRAHGRVPAISGIGGGGWPRPNDALVEGLSAFPCYEPLFGYRLQTFPKALGRGSALRDPACYLYGRENGCRPGDPFPPSAARSAAAFAAYRPFPFVLPWWQSWADRITLAAAAATMLALALAFRGWLRGRRQAPLPSSEAAALSDRKGLAG
jgi:hypothetical protein